MIPVTNSNETTPFNWQAGRKKPDVDLPEWEQEAIDCESRRAQHMDWLAEVNRTTALCQESFNQSIQNIDNTIASRYAFLDKLVPPKTTNPVPLADRDVIVIQTDLQTLVDKISSCFSEMSQSVKAIALIILALAVSAIGYVSYNYVSGTISQ
jgi:hypothetical protein